MEIFLLDNTNFFFNFKDKIANQVYIQIRSLRPPNLVSKYSFDVIRRNQLTQQWQRREISNFDYLMALNTASGRTFSDLAQYPVMPWILSDYTSKELNFEDYGIYRDFSKPVGAQSAKNRQEIKTKYETFEDPTGLVPKFHYGSHYSSPAVVAHYLVRVEPFTSLHVDLQGGRFDLADRQFVSIPSTWRSLLDSPSDVKELIPELFTTPDLLWNKNRFDLGKLQGSEDAVNDVVLPPWANSPEDFMAKHREALECEYVSRNLHSWINLIFGNKQKGPQAVDALNVFYYSSYEDAVNLELITDEKEKIAVAEMIRHFGQTPIQLFRFPHPPRLPLEELKPLFAKNGSIRRPSIAEFPNCRISYVQSMNEGVDAVVWLAFPQRARTLLSPPQNNDPWNLFSISADRRCFIYKLYGNVKSTLEREEISSRLEAQRHLPTCFHPAISISSEIFALTPDGKFLLAGGSWDSNLMVFSVAAGKEVRLEHTLVGHTEPVTCISADRVGLYCVSGSKDTTCIIWSISELVSMQPSRDPVPKQVHVLIGHRTPLVAVAISTELDVVVSASSDGTVLVHSVKTGIYQWAITPFEDLPTTVLKLSVGEEGDVAIVAQKGSEYTIVSSTLNGKTLASIKVQHRPTVLFAGRQHLLIGDVAGNLEMRKTWSLTRVLHFAFPEPITSAAVTPAWTHFIVSLKDGTMVVVEPDLKIRKTPPVLNV